MAKPRPKANPSLAPQFFKGGWFYDYRGRIDVLIETPHGTFSVRIPWKKLIPAAKRCRPEEFPNAR